MKIENERQIPSLESFLKNNIRWIQRFSNYLKALGKLSEAVCYINTNKDADNSAVNDIIKEGLIQRFEYTHELAWNVMKDYAEYQGNSLVGGSRDAVREALKLQIISNGKVWMDMINSRNMTSHTYNQETAEEIINKILNDYHKEFLAFKSIMEIKVYECDLG